MASVRITIAHAFETTVLLYPTDWAEKNVGSVLEFTLRQFWTGIKVFLKELHPCYGIFT